MLRRRKTEFRFDPEPATQEAENGEEVVNWCSPEQVFIQKKQGPSSPGLLRSYRRL